jgi:tRNA A-37 threonylcarbamoyl transferase component Bud32
MAYYVKQNVAFKEFMMHEYIYTISSISNGILNVPKIIFYNVDTFELTMEKIDNMNVADFYGEEADQIEPELFSQIREIICFLYENHIIYPDITGYNFIEHEGKLWIIDFEHSDFKTHHPDPFVERFVRDVNYHQWNPLFA